MDSDSSMDEDRNRWNKQDMVPIRPNMNEQDNSDVSDEENISRAARSIESPPESPQGGTHFESPPASPDPENKPGTPSPIQSPDDSASYESPLRSPDSQADSRNLKNGSPPRSPDSFLPRSPNAVRFTNRSPPSDHRKLSPTTNYRRSPSPFPSHSLRNESLNSGQSRVHGSKSKFPRSPSPVCSPNSRQSLKNLSPNSIQSPEKSRSPHSPNSIQSAASANQYGIQSPPQRIQSPTNYIRSPSPYRSHNQSDSPTNRSRRRNSESPPRSCSPMQQSSPRKFKSHRTPSPLSPERQPTRRDSNSDDGRSNISSASSFSSPGHSPSPRPRTPPSQHSAPLRVKTVAELKSHAEDLSDVSDIDSINSMSDDESEKPKSKDGELRSSVDTKKDMSSLRNTTSSGGLEGDDTEQLDFEAEEKEEGECEVQQPTVTKTAAPTTEVVMSEDEGELKGDELEEGEITDEGEARPEETEPRPICRFYNRGQCTWGASCRFVHPGVTDKGNYTMFEMVRPLVPVNGPPPMYGPPVDPYRPIERPIMGPPVYQQPPPRKEEPPVVESAWERGLRQAKEMLMKSSKRKETEVDFEEKKMNLSLGQDELDKENDYYARPTSPILNEEPDRWAGKVDGEKRYRSMYDEYGSEYYSRYSEQVWHQRPHYDESMRGVYSSRSAGGGKYSYPTHSSREKEYYSGSTTSKRQKYSTQREVIVQRPEKTTWKDDTSPRPSRYVEPSKSTSGRGDDWADPWMRSKTSPLSRKQRSRKQSYTSGSSYSSSSSSRSSRSSSSSYSRSRSRSRSSRSRSRSKPSKMSPPRRLLRAPSPISKGPKVTIPTALLSEKKPIIERSIMMNPPPPSPRTKPKPLGTNPSPPNERVRPGMPARMLAHSKAASAVAAAMRSARSKSKSSRSSSNSDSSGSSSDSSESSFSSSSSSRPASPPVRQKRIVIDERLALAQAMKVKAMDALKLSGQKQQIKLTLKGSGPGDRPMPSTSIAGKKRPAESPPMDFSPPKAGGKITPKKTAPSRREELLKQLKAVEDAIARKRSKIN